MPLTVVMEKIGLLKKLGIEVEDEKKTGQVENILAVIDQIVNGEMNLPPGEHEELFALVREVGKGYTVVGTTWTYNERNQITHKENHIRMEEYDYLHDDAGNMTSNERSQYSWNAKGLLEEVVFPDGSGQKYEYDIRGRRTKTTQFNHQENSQWETNYYYKGDSWNIDRETDQDGNIIMEYTYDERNKPLSVTYKGETFWYVYNGHGDVVALTDINGQVAARYEYDEWGLPTKMYNRYGERVREGIGWIGDLNTGNGTPGSKNEETDNDEIDQHPGNGNTKEKTNNKNGDKNIKTDDAGITVDNVEITVEEETVEEITTEEVTIKDEVTADITTDLVKENPYRYAGYYFDRKTQFYYLQARYYDARVGRFISLDPIRGDLSNPLSLNRYLYTTNNPVNYVDPTGHWLAELDVYSKDPFKEKVKELESMYTDNPVKLAQAYLEYIGYDIGDEGIDGISVPRYETWQAIKTFQELAGLPATGYITGFDDPTLKKMKQVVSNWTIYMDNYNPKKAKNYYDETLPEYTIVEDLIPFSDHARPGIKLRKVEAIVVHWVGGKSVGVPAKNIRDYFASDKEDDGSSQYIVGINGEVILAVPENEVSYHAGESNSSIAKERWPSGNANWRTIGIETVPMDVEGNFNNKTYTTLVRLSADLLKKYNLNPDTDLLRHKDISNKPCPMIMVNEKNTKNWVEETGNNPYWAQFKEDVKKAMVR